MSSRAIVTLTVGSEHRDRWLRRCEENWGRYAERHGFDLIRFDQPLDGSERASKRSPSWQKLLICEQPTVAGYERVVWVDSDILFGVEAASVGDDVPAELVGAVDELDVPSPELLNHIHPGSMPDFYAAAGLPGHFEKLLQAGLLVLSPANHAEILRSVYDNHEDPGPNLNYEMRPLSYELQRAERVHWLDRRFNFTWPLYKAYRYPFLIPHPGHPRAHEAIMHALEEVHCLHFAGCADELDSAFESEARRLAAHQRRRRRTEVSARSPVVMLTYARPDTTRRVLDAVREAKPPRLLVVSDAPRAGADEEAERCGQTRALFETVDWDCEVSTNFAEAHLGITKRIESGLDWAFELEPEAIVLEDDCVPDPTFFAFCDELLQRHRESERVMSICGTNYLFDRTDPPDGYLLSRYFHSGAWASWRRAWRLYDRGLERWPELAAEGWLEKRFGTASHGAAYWRHIFDRAHEQHDAWDAAWVFTCWAHGGLHALPNVNLITNIGFRADATNTRPEHRGAFNDVPTEPAEFPLRQPSRLETDDDADAFIESNAYSGEIDQIFRRIRTARTRGERVGIR
jgi:hypothetical protein